MATQKNLIYIGNKLSVHGNNLTGIETLGPSLEKVGFNVIYASSCRNKLLRLGDMLVTTLRFGLNARAVLIDTYSTSNFWYAFLISQLCRIMRCPYVPILRGGDLPRRLAQNPTLCKMLFNHSLVNISPSGYLAEAFGKAGYQTTIIPNAIHIEVYRFKSRAAFAPKLLWVRAFDAIYNPQMALYVLQEVQKRYPNAELCMVGPDKDGSLEKTKSLAQELGLNVKFTGKLPKPQWLEIAQNYDIFINTTHFDNMPVSVIEAMALGLAVVSTDVGGIPFLVEDGRTGLLVADNDSSGMAKCIEKLAEQPEMATEFVQNAHALVNGFDVPKVVKQWLEILK